MRSVSRRLAAELGAFGVVGAVNTALDIVLFNLLLFGPLPSAWAAKACSTTVSAVSSYLMNRHWTWRDRSRRGLRRELSLFLVMSAVALGISEACLLVSHDLLGWRSPAADNISANVVGLAAATAFRFWSFRTFVFRPHPLPAAPTAVAVGTPDR